MDKVRLFAVLLALGVAACAERTPEEQAALCRERFQDYDRSLRFDRLEFRLSQPPGDVFGFPDPSGRRLAAENALRQFGCTTQSAEIADLSDPRGAYGTLRNGESGPDRAPAFYQLGIVVRKEDEVALTRFFAALGYPVRTVFAERLGYRIFLGPITSGGAALALEELARSIGFPSGYFVKEIPMPR